MSKRKIKDLFEDKLVAEVYERVRQSDGKKFYDTTIQRRYFDNTDVEHRTNFFQRRDMLSLHALAVTIERYIANQVWKARNTPRVPVEKPVEPETETEADDDTFLEA